jgi:LmbE family N-acetylglucosaminyl deacetylase
MSTSIYLSPHLDDAVLSCGALIHKQTQAGEKVVVITVCAGNPPPGPLTPFTQSLHARWKLTAAEAVASRRTEDVRALQVLGAEPVYLWVPDCIYRTSPAGEPVVKGEADLFGPLSPLDEPLVSQLATQIADLLPRWEPAQVYAPLSIGRHVDHQLTRRAAEQLGRPLIYVEDYPYAAKNSAEGDWGGLTRGLAPQRQPVGEDGWAAHCRAVAAYASQISTFWPDEATMRQALRQHLTLAEGVLGLKVWR